MKRGNCYVTCEALYHLMGGKDAGYTPHHMYWEGDSHWFLVKRHIIPMGPHNHPCNVVIDPTASQFKVKPDYRLGIPKGFLTKQPSKRAKLMMEEMLYQRKKK